MSFGHCGIDWLHSLLDSHHQILIMPCFSFYRTWKLLNLDSVNDYKEMHKLWVDHFNSEGMQGKDTKQFYDAKETKFFSDKLFKNLNNNGIDKKETLSAIFDAYAFAKNIDLKKIKVIIEHEHISFSYKEIIKDFDYPNILMIYRDPRASIAGYFKGINKKYGNYPDAYEYFFNMSIEEWMNSIDLLKEYRSQLDKQFKLVKNEDLSRNTKQEMIKISNWLGVDYKDSLIKSSYPSGLDWITDSSYLKKDQTLSDLDENYFTPTKIKERWLEILNDKRDLIMVEFLFGDFMLEFGYNRITKNNLYTKIKGLFYFIKPHRGPNHFKNYKINEDELFRVRNRLKLLNKRYIVYIWNFLPMLIQRLLIKSNSIFKHVSMYFFPGDRWKRYDNQIIDKSFRIT